MLSDGELELVRHCTPTRVRRTSDKVQAAYRRDMNLVPMRGPKGRIIYIHVFAVLFATIMLIFPVVVIGIEGAIPGCMHVHIERLYEFVMGNRSLNKDESSHLTQCTFCLVWLRACVEEKFYVRAKIRFLSES